MQKAATEIRIWDPFVRLFHWSVVIGFFIAYFTEGEGSVELLHVWAGYVIGSLVLIRIFWGFVGPRHARFSDFVTSPVDGLRYLIGLVTLRSRRYVGHSPAGGWMVLMLMAGLLATVAAGMLTYGAEGKGPLAPYVASAGQSMPAVIPAARADEDEGHGEHRQRNENERTFKEIHETLANIVLILVILHLCGVLGASLVHRENLVRAMITGKKRAND